MPDSRQVQEESEASPLPPPIGYMLRRLLFPPSPFLIHFQIVLLSTSCIQIMHSLLDIANRTLRKGWCLLIWTAHQCIQPLKTIFLIPLFINYWIYSMNKLINLNHVSNLVYVSFKIFILNYLFSALAVGDPLAWVPYMLVDSRRVMSLVCQCLCICATHRQWHMTN